MSVPSATGIPTSYVPPRRVDPRFAYHTLSAGLVPVNEFRSKQSLWSSLPGGWDGLGNFVTNSAYQVWGTKRESGLSVIQVLDISMISMGPLLVANLHPYNSIAVLLEYSVSVQWII